MPYKAHIKNNWPNFMKDKIITIVGLGMLGASIAESLKKFNGYKSIQAYARRQESVDKAMSLGIVDFASSDAKEILGNSDLTVICTPIPITERFVKENAAFFKPGSIITDIASTKSLLVTNCREALKNRPDLCFIGGHPMAGSEKSGMEYRNCQMYKNAKVFLTPEEGDPRDAVYQIEKMWNALGAYVIEIDKDKHDEVVAYASQALHIVASAAARAVLGNEDGRLCAAASAGGFRDLTRIASSNPTMWREILENNPAGNIIALTQIIEELNSALQLMKTNNWSEIEEFFAVGKKLKDEYLKNRDLL